jgi:raffinose/stachyose/melibiose transport system substrate-binding protein
MKHTKIMAFTGAALIAAGLVFVTGCSSKSKTTELELFSTKGENADTLNKLINKFTTEKNGTVKITLVSPADAGTVLRARLTKNDIPDIIAVGGDATYTELESSGVLADLTNEPFMSNITRGYLDMVFAINKDHEKKLFAVPYASNASGILYNRALFEKAGVTVPHTWTEFLDVISKLKAAGIQPFELTFLDAWTCLPPWNSMAPVLQPAGFTDDRRAGKTTFAATHGPVMEKYLVLLENSQGNDFMGTSYNDGNKYFAEGKAAMMINGIWAIPEFLKVNPAVDVDSFAFPTTDDPSKNTVTSGIDVALCISSTTKHAEIAKEFITFMLQQENAQQYINEQFAFSAVKGVKQMNKTVAGLQNDISAGKVSDFPDHYYPSGFDLASVLSEFALNYTKKIDNAQNIADTLKKCDQQYDTVNVK